MLIGHKCVWYDVLFSTINGSTTVKLDKNITDTNSFRGRYTLVDYGKSRLV